MIGRNHDAAPFEHSGGETGVLLLHGFSGTPAEVRALGARLHARGYGVTAPALPGHTGDREALHTIGVDDYLRAAEAAHEMAQRRFRTVFVVGFSMGGALGLHLAQHKRIDALVTINTPIEMPAHVMRGVPFVAKIAAKAPLPVNVRALFGHPGHPTMPAHAVATFLAVLKRVKRGLSSISAPLLVVQSTRDETVAASNADAIATAVGDHVQRFIVKDGPHLLTMGRWLDVIEPPIARFLADADRGLIRDGRTTAGLP